MPLYEHVYLARQDLSAQQVEEMTANYKGVIEGLGGKLVGDPEYWGVKTLSFRIRKNRKAHFTMFKLDAPPAAARRRAHLAARRRERDRGRDPPRPAGARDGRRRRLRDPRSSS